jgi:hypothetical protein
MNAPSTDFGSLRVLPAKERKQRKPGFGMRKYGVERGRRSQRSGIDRVPGRFRTLLLVISGLIFLAPPVVSAANCQGSEILQLLISFFHSSSCFCCQMLDEVMKKSFKPDGVITVRTASTCGPANCSLYMITHTVRAWTSCIMSV